AKLLKAGVVTPIMRCSPRPSSPARTGSAPDAAGLGRLSEKSQRESGHCAVKEAGAFQAAKFSHRTCPPGSVKELRCSAGILTQFEAEDGIIRLAGELGDGRGRCKSDREESPGTVVRHGRRENRQPDLRR